ncbi:hypothetical protein IE53DRAFT_161641 [Violaceomyces palustris]|uniref:Uncharacterized protein n=1 Tax=Violaceomyces palustris TaxID=1673888 RepID=A0ACD0NTT0_9BASI|nr:hypothetical protein IE53DRAFT_161641 [Violaceomyces palustris]
MIPRTLFFPFHSLKPFSFVRFQSANPAFPSILHTFAHPEPQSTGCVQQYQGFHHPRSPRRRMSAFIVARNITFAKNKRFFLHPRPWHSDPLARRLSIKTPRSKVQTLRQQPSRYPSGVQGGEGDQPLVFDERKTNEAPRAGWNAKTMGKFVQV